MSSQKIVAYWSLGLAIAGVVVGLVVVLLAAIIATANAIATNVGRIEAVAKDIVSNTAPVWKLGDIDRSLGEIFHTARSMGQHASETADALEHPQARSSSEGG